MDKDIALLGGSNIAKSEESIVKHPTEPIRKITREVRRDSAEQVVRFRRQTEA
jgi:hypothetical protein